PRPPPFPYHDALPISLRRDVPLGELEVGDALFADEVQLGVGVLRFELFQTPPRLANQVRVERAAQATIRGDEQHGNAPHSCSARSEEHTSELQSRFDL